MTDPAPSFPKSIGSCPAPAFVSFAHRATPLNTPGGFYDAKKDQTFREIVKNSPKSYAASFKTNQKRIDLPTEKKGSTDVLYNPRNGTFTEIMAKKGNASAMKSNVKRQAFTDTKFKLGNGPDRFYDVHRGTMAEDTKKSPRGYSAAFKTTQKRIDDSRDRFKLGSVDIMYDAKDPRYVTPAYKTRPQVAAFGSSVPRTKKRREPKVSKDGGSRRGSRAGSSVGTNTPKNAGDVTPKSAGGKTPKSVGDETLWKTRSSLMSKMSGWSEEPAMPDTPDQ